MIVLQQVRPSEAAHQSLVSPPGPYWIWGWIQGAENEASGTIPKQCVVNVVNILYFFVKACQSDQSDMWLFDTLIPYLRSMKNKVHAST